MLIYLVYLLIDSHFTHGYNYGLGYIASVLKKNGYDVKYIPLWNQNDVLNFYSDIKHEKPAIVAFSATSSQFPYLRLISNSIKSFSKTFQVCGGTHVTLRPDSIQEIQSLDAIVIGEGEFPMLDLANAIANGKNFYNIKNFWFRKENDIIRNSIRPLIEDLNLLPFPDKSSLDYQKLIDISGGKNRFIFSRGCTFKCSYCSNHALKDVYPNKNKYYRFIEPELAIEQIRRDEQKYNFNYIVFDDDTISLNKKWFFNFFELYRQNFTYPFRCNLRVETVNEDVIKLLKEANGQGIGIGLEHGNEEFRKNTLARRMKNSEIKRVFELCDKYELSHDDFMMVGFPGEDINLYFDTVRLSREVGANGRTSIFQPYPSTILADVCETNNWLPKKEIFKERKEAVIDFPNFSKEEIQLCANLFPLLNQNKFIPLINSLIYLKILWFIYRANNKIRRTYKYFSISIKTLFLSLFKI